MTRNSGDRYGLATIIGAILLMYIAQPAAAALLFGNPNAMLSGTVPLLDSNSGNLHYGDVEYAVFNSAGWLTAFPGEDTPNGGVAAGETIYAFQVYDNGAKANGITQFSAGLGDAGPPGYGDGLDDNELVNAGDQDFVALGGQVPSFTQVAASLLWGAVNGGSVKFNFVGAGPRLQNEWSSVLYYTSPYGPTWDNASTTTGAGESRIPGPEVGVPEPASFAMAFGFVVGIAAWRRRSRAI
jgi:hypothetical protein